MNTKQMALLGAAAVAGFWFLSRRHSVGSGFPTGPAGTTRVQPGPDPSWLASFTPENYVRPTGGYVPTSASGLAAKVREAVTGRSSTAGDPRRGTFPTGTTYTAPSRSAAASKTLIEILRGRQANAASDPRAGTFPTGATVSNYDAGNYGRAVTAYRSGGAAGPF